MKDKYGMLIVFFIISVIFASCGGGGGHGDDDSGPGNGNGNGNVPSVKQVTSRVSLNADGAQIFFGGSSAPEISDDGRFVVFASAAGDIVPGDTNSVSDIFVHDRDTDEDGTFDEAGAIATLRVSVTSAGAQTTFGESSAPHISADGRFIVFQSASGDLVPGDSNGLTDIFVHDRDTDNDSVFDEAGAIATLRASVTSTGAQTTFAGSSAPRISADGRFVVFQSASGDLVPGDSNGLTDIFVHDRDTDNDSVFDEAGAIATIRASVKSDGTQVTSGSSSAPSLNADGRFVVFESTAVDLVPDDSNGLKDIFVRDRDYDANNIFDEL